MKFSVFTALMLAWLYGTVAGLLLPHGPLALALYGLFFGIVASVVCVAHRAIRYQLAMVEFRQEMSTARRLALQAYGRN